MGKKHHSHPGKNPIRRELPDKETGEAIPKPGQPPDGGERRLTSRDQLSAMRAIRDLEKVDDKERKRRIERSLDLGLEAAKSVQDRRISLFVRGDQPQFAGINTFAHAPYCENINEVGQYDVAFVGLRSMPEQPIAPARALARKGFGAYRLLTTPTVPTWAWTCANN